MSAVILRRKPWVLPPWGRIGHAPSPPPTPLPNLYPNLNARRSVASLAPHEMQRRAPALLWYRPRPRPPSTASKSKIMGFMRDFSAPATPVRTPSPALELDEQGSALANARKALAIARDFRTDTITIPTEEMCRVMARASRGDDVYGEDQATADLEVKVARMAGKEAAMFAVSGTMTNQLAIRSHLHQPPHSIILDSRAHVHLHEAGGVAMHSQATSHALRPENGHHLTLSEILDNVVEGTDIHTAPTRLVSLENTLSGMIFPQEEVERIGVAMKELGIIMHLDGARLWEVVAASGKSLDELCRPFDSVTLCMSKGLGAPVGSILVGSKELITRCKWFRKAFGGGIRQSGSLAAAANYALEHHLPLLPSTHQLAKHLATELAALGVRLLLPVETNMLWIDPTPLGFSLPTLASAIRSRGLNMGGARIVIHHQISPEAVEDFLLVVRELKEAHGGEAGKLDEGRRNEEYARGVWEGKVKGMSTRTTAYAAAGK